MSWISAWRWRRCAAFASGALAGALVAAWVLIGLLRPAIEDTQRRRWDAMAAERLSLAPLCAAYREWATAAGMTAPGMEKLCG